MEEFLPDFSTLDQFNQEALRSIALATKASNEIPSDRKEDWDFYTTFKSFRQVTSAQSETTRNLLAKLLEHAGIKKSVPKNDFTTTEDILEFLSDVNDHLLERIGTTLDEAAGLKKEVDPVLVEITSSPASIHRRSEVKLLAGRNVTRPQIAFKDCIDNSVKTPFIPKLTEKPHSLKPLSILVEYSDQNEEIYSHPYTFEIDNLKFRSSQFEKSEPIDASDIEKTPLSYIDTKELLDQMINELKTETEIGIDLEAHTYRSFQGITCLLQISSRTKDYIVDPFPIWQDLTSLNEILADPKILKIFHGARNDIQWLQRDFSLYVVNMFDSYVATQVLDFPRGCRGLAFLLHSVAKVQTDKKYQMADWRIRPIPSEMVKYARLDSHYMIKIYHDLKTKLINQGNENLNLLRSVYDQSNELCKQRHQKPLFKENSSFSDYLQKNNITHLNGKQRYGFMHLFNWRNSMARQEDESEHYVLPIHMLLKICTELPREMQGILACCNPVPPMVKQNLQALHEIILRSRDQQINITNASNSENDENKTQPSSNQTKLEILKDPLKCPLDLTNFDEEQEGLDVFLSKDEMKIETSVKIQPKDNASIESFGNKSEIQPGNALTRVFLSPFERYKMLKPYLDSMASKKEDKKDKISDEDRIQSIKDHFDNLTALTAKDMEEDNAKESGEKDEAVEEDVEEMDMDEYDPDPGKVQNLRAGLSKKGNKKRQNALKNEENNVKKTKIDVENVDFSQYSSGVDPKAKTFDPMNDLKNGANKKKNFGKPRHRAKNKTGKSMTFKK